MEHLQKVKSGIELYRQGQTMTAASKEVGISCSCLQRHLSELGLNRSNKQLARKYHVNHDYFEKIDHEGKAYWLGFLYADGYITGTKQKNVGLAISSKDRDHLSRFGEMMSSTYPVKDYDTISFGTKIQYSRILYTSDKLYNDLLKKGLMPRKSLILKFPGANIVPKSLMHHFVRGYFDGDGSLSKASKGYALKVCGTFELLNSLKIWLGFPNHKLSKRHKDDKNSYSLEIGGNLQVITCCRKFYRDSTIHLDRKHIRFLELIDRYPDYV